MTNNIKEIEKRIEKYLQISLQKENCFKNNVTFKFLEEFYEDFFIFADISFNCDTLTVKRNEINHVLELIILNDNYNEFDVEILNTLVNFIDDYIELFLLQERE